MQIGLNLPPQFRVYAGFGTYAFGLGNIFPRIPEIQRQLDVGEGALGASLIGLPVGTLVGLTVAAPILARIGFRATLIWVNLALAAFAAVAIHATSPLAFFLLLIPMGLATGLVETVVNAEADRVEHALGTRIMNRAHAFWSFGFFSAALFGSVVAGLGISPQAQLGMSVVITGFLIALLLGRFEPAPARPRAEADGKPPLVALPNAGILILVAVTLSAMLMEGAGLDWSAIYMRDAFDATKVQGGLAVAAFVGSQAATRFFADGFVERHSPALVARGLLMLVFVGCVTVSFSPVQGLSYLGLALMGVGTSAIFPLAMSAAAQRQDRPAVVNIAALAQTAFVTFLIGPPLLGFLAEAWGIRSVYAVGLPLIVLSFVTAGALGHRSAKQG